MARFELTTLEEMLRLIDLMLAVHIAPCGRAYRGNIGAHLDSPLAGVSV
jgi:hypothetical protein